MLMIDAIKMKMKNPLDMKYFLFAIILYFKISKMIDKK